MFSVPAGYSLEFSPGVGNLASTVPEPPTWAMMLLGFAGLGFAGYRASRARAALSQPKQRVRAEADAMETVRSLPFLCAAAVCFAFGQTQALAYTDFGQGRPISAKDCSAARF